MSPNSFQGLYEVRDAKPEDKNFILASFLRALYHGDSWFSFIPRGIFMSNYSKIAEIIITNPKNIVKIACLREDPDTILGYSILSGDYQGIHFCYVRKAWRDKGIGRSLVPQYPSYVTHLTNVGRELMSKFPKTTIFNPFI